MKAQSDNRSEYLQSLERELRSLPESERNEILRDQDEYIREAIASGRSELDVLLSLGEPKALAKSLIAESHIDAAVNKTTEAQKSTSSMGSIARAVFALVALAPFNLIFVLFPLFLVAVMLFCCWMFSIGGVFAGFGIIGTMLFQWSAEGISGWAHMSTFMTGLSICAFSGAALIAMSYLTATLGTWIVRYLKWNLSFVTSRA